MFFSTRLPDANNVPSFTLSVARWKENSSVSRTFIGCWNLNERLPTNRYVFSIHVCDLPQAWLLHMTRMEVNFIAPTFVKLGKYGWRTDCFKQNQKLPIVSPIVVNRTDRMLNVFVKPRNKVIFRDPEDKISKRDHRNCGFSPKFSDSRRQYKQNYVWG